MIKLLWKFIKFLVKTASKILGFLIVKLYLWIPISFAVIFAFASAAVPFSFLEYLPHFIVLVAGGTVLSMLLFVRKLVAPKKPQKAKDNPQETDKNVNILPSSQKKWLKSKEKNYAKNPITQSQFKEPVESMPRPRQADFYQEQWNQPEPYDYREQYVGPNDIKKSLLQRRSAEWFNVAYEVIPEKDIRVKAPDIPDLKSYTDNLKSCSNNYDVSFEEPAKLYRTRKDPSLFIAEYPDRLEYYRKTSNGLILVSVEENTLRLQNNY
ncbi:MAG TPA: hypothetical protein VIL23_05910 [Clostridia bacterium]